MLNLRRFDVQAKVAVVASVLALFCMIALIPMVFKDFNSESMMIYYSKKTMRLPVIFACGGVAIALGTFGAGLGFSSAGQRRNDRQGLSWLGFFLGSGVIASSIILLAIFWFWKETILMQ